jgi:signal transduction histidine kinase
MSTMTATPARTAAVASPIAAAVLAAAGGLGAVWARAGDTADPTSSVALATTIALVALTGCVLALARPANRIGWVVVLAAAAWGVGEGCYDLGVRGIVTAPGTIHGAGALAVAGAALRAIGWTAAAVAVPAIFPDGRLPGPRWRWVGYTLAGALATTFIGTTLASFVDSDELRAAGWRNPLAVPAAVARFGDALTTASLPLMAATVAGGVAAIVYRWRRGDPARRRQLLTFATAAALPVVVIPTAFGAGWPPWVFAAAVAPLPLAVATAILTGGMFDVATVANRSLVWGTLSAAIVGIYVLVIAGTGALLGDAGARWLPWLGTGVVAVSFAPLRNALHAAADRITYGRWREPYEVLAGLSPRIGVAPGAERLLREVVAELSETLGLTGVVLRDPDGRPVAEPPPPVAPAPMAGPPAATVAVPGETALALVAYGRLTGELRYTEPASPLRPADRRLLDDLAAQLALLMHARALTEDLRRARERLVLAREEERRRLRRDLHDGLGPALAGLMLKVDNARALIADDPATAGRDLLVLRGDIQNTVVDVRRLVEGLRPPAIDELGLGPAITEAVGRLASRTGTAVEVSVDASLPPVPAAVEVALYRIVAEAVTNAVRHADAATCRVTVTVRGGELVATILDDGSWRSSSPRVADPAGGNGLATMRERAEELGGALRVDANGDGTMVTAVLPLLSTVPAGADG